jgi:molybdopterin-synthase adenylyltransferase
MVTTAEPDRYSRQRVLPEIGAEGQRRIQASVAVVIGCGALGCVQAQLLVRAGVGTLRIVDRDLVEEHNLHRQLLFDEEDARARLPKAVAAARRLAAVNSRADIRALVVDANADNVEELVSGADVVLDGTDNFETRYLLNDACVKHGTPWVYGGVVGTVGVAMTVLPGAGPCLRCLWLEAPEPGLLPTCETAGVLNTVPTLIAAWQATEALKLLVGVRPQGHGLLTVDLWEGSLQTLAVRREPTCPCCGERRFELLDGRRGSRAAVLCGAGAVQVTPARGTSFSFDDLCTRLAPLAGVTNRGYLVELRDGELELVVFRDGRAIVRGTDDVARARGLYARYVGT